MRDTLKKTVVCSMMAGSALLVAACGGETSTNTTNVTDMGNDVMMDANATDMGLDMNATDMNGMASDMNGMASDVNAMANDMNAMANDTNMQ